MQKSQPTGTVLRSSTCCIVFAAGMLQLMLLSRACRTFRLGVLIKIAQQCAPSVRQWKTAD